MPPGKILQRAEARCPGSPSASADAVNGGSSGAESTSFRVRPSCNEPEVVPVKVDVTFGQRRACSGILDDVLHRADGDDGIQHLGKLVIGYEHTLAKVAPSRIFRCMISSCCARDSVIPWHSFTPVLRAWNSRFAPHPHPMSRRRLSLPSRADFACHWSLRTCASSSELVCQPSLGSSKIPHV